MTKVKGGYIFVGELIPLNVPEVRSAKADYPGYFGYPVAVLP